MDPYTDKLAQLDQDELIELLNWEARTAKSLRAKVIKSQQAELSGYHHRKESASWSNSEQFEKCKDRIRAIVKRLI